MHFPINLPSSARFDAVGFGTNAVDHLISVPSYPDFGSKIELTEHVQAAGGEVATTMAGLARLGLKTAYVGRFGDDDAGKIGIDSLTTEGVDVSYCEQVRGGQTQTAFIVIDVRNGERTVIWKRDPRLFYSEAEAPVAIAGLGRILHLTPHDTRACIRLAKAAREKGVPVSIDIDKSFDGVEDLLPLVDVMIASAEFPRDFFGITDLRTALTEFASRFGCAVVGSTLGDKGSILLVDGRFVETPGFAVPGGCRDTTGAGDSFRVGLIYGLLKGESVEESARMANAVAALKCRAVGARTSLPTETELCELLEKTAETYRAG